MISDSDFENVYLRAPAENEMKQKMVSLECYERNEGFGKELSQCFELTENSSTLLYSEVCPRSSEIEYMEDVVVPDNFFKVSETHSLSRGLDISNVETFGGPLHTITSSLDVISEHIRTIFSRGKKPKGKCCFWREKC